MIFLYEDGMMIDDAFLPKREEAKFSKEFIDSLLKIIFHDE